MLQPCDTAHKHMSRGQNKPKHWGHSPNHSLSKMTVSRCNAPVNSLGPNLGHYHTYDHHQSFKSLLPMTAPAHRFGPEEGTRERRGEVGAGVDRYRREKKTTEKGANGGGRRHASLLRRKALLNGRRRGKKTGVQLRGMHLNKKMSFSRLMHSVDGQDYLPQQWEFLMSDSTIINTCCRHQSRNLSIRRLRRMPGPTRGTHTLDSHTPERAHADTPCAMQHFLHAPLLCIVYHWCQLHITPCDWMFRVTQYWSACCP